MPGGGPGQLEGASADLRVRADVGVQRGRRLEFEVDGEPVVAFEGETVAAALLAHGIRILRTTAAGETRGLFCGTGVCYDCLMVIDGRPSRRACMEPARDGMEVRTQAGPGESP